MDATNQVPLVGFRLALNADADTPAQESQTNTMELVSTRTRSNGKLSKDECFEAKSSLFAYGQPG